MLWQLDVKKYFQRLLKRKIETGNIHIPLGSEGEKKLQDEFHTASDALRFYNKQVMPK